MQTSIALKIFTVQVLYLCRCFPLCVRLRVGVSVYVSMYENADIKGMQLCP